VGGDTGGEDGDPDPDPERLEVEQDEPRGAALS
jgi:hypothetical protein